MDKRSNLSWHEAWIALINGNKVKLPHWAGYWAWENNTVMMHCRDGRVVDIRDTDNPAYTLTNMASKDWEIVVEEEK